MTYTSGSRHRLRGIVVLVMAVSTSLAAAACDRESADLTPAVTDPEGSVALAPGEVNPFIRPGGEYRIGGEDSPFQEAALPARLRVAYSEAPASGRVLNIHAYPGVVGYDVVLAMNAAREHGVEQVRGIADYGDSASSRPQWKRWEQALNSSGARPLSRDTLRH